jgi:Reverse transcriptase (RNA-dependent DNA polymerase)
MAKLLNDYFSSVFSEEGDGAVPRADQCDVDDNLVDVVVDEQTVRKKIRSLKPASAPGPDGMGSLLLKELVDQVVKPLTINFNNSLTSSAVPEDWRRANVTPIYKKGTKSDPSNYRPVSLTSICCKLLKSVIRDNIVHHMEQNGLIEGSQHGFVKTRSCTTNLIEFLDNLTEIMEEGGSADAIFLDFAKAFDKVPKKRLLEIFGKAKVSWNWRSITGLDRELVVREKTESCSQWRDVQLGAGEVRRTAR